MSIINDDSILTYIALANSVSALDQQLVVEYVDTLQGGGWQSHPIYTRLPAPQQPAQYSGLEHLVLAACFLRAGRAAIEAGKLFRADGRRRRKKMHNVMSGVETSIMKIEQQSQSQSSTQSQQQQSQTPTEEMWEVLDEWQPGDDDEEDEPPEDLIDDGEPIGMFRGAGIEEVDEPEEMDFEPKLKGSAFQNSLQHLIMQPKKSHFDLRMFLDSARPKLVKLLREQLKDHYGLKVFMVLDVEYIQLKKMENIEKHGSDLMDAALHTRGREVYNDDCIDDCVNELYHQIDMRNTNFIRDSSGLVLREIFRLNVHICQYRPVAGGSFVELPRFLKNKKAIVNVKNNDERCFGYAVAAALHPRDRKQHQDRASVYDKYFHTDKLDQLTYPIEPTNLSEVEDTLGLKINVFSFFDDEGKGRYPLHMSTKNFETEIDLLYWSGHYAWIKDFGAFLFDLTKYEHRKFFCKRCFGHAASQADLDLHQQFCKREHDQRNIFTMPQPGTKLKFINIRNQMRLPFAFYIDFECLTKPSDRETTSGRGITTKFYQDHVPCSVGIKVVSTCENFPDMPYETYTGPCVTHWLLCRLRVLEKMCIDFIFDDKRMKMTDDDRRAFRAAKECHICHKAFKGTDNVVKDHCHFTGKYRGAAHNRCNLQLRKKYQIPMFLHNFKNYDSHLITMALGMFPEVKLDVIGLGMEKYLAMYWSDHLVFKDSLQFLTASLEALTANLLKSGADKFKHLIKGFNNHPDINLLLRKGIYPYDYVGSWDKLKDRTLPPQEAFDNRLRGAKCSDEDYRHALNVFEKFHCTSFLDYHNLYLKCDVLLLADIFEAFRELCLKHYELDAAHYVSAPQLSYDAMLRITGAEISLLSDPEMYETIDDGVRGGVCQISQRYARANNPKLGAANYDPSKPTTHILYTDANNLYGYSMSEPLPSGGFKWLTEEEWTQIDRASIREDSPIGYIYVVDLDYPEHLHDKHNDFPVAAERLTIDMDMLSATSVNIRRNYRMPRNVQTTKLVPTLMAKKEHACHIRNLQFYEEEGLVVTKIYKVLQFDQSPWLKPYIDLNSKLRAESKDDFSKDFFKKMNNCIYGKTVENLKKRTDIQLVVDDKRRKKLVEKPHMMGFRIFSETTVGIQLKKVRSKIDKPTFVGFVVLELSKLFMLIHRHRRLRQRYGDKCRILYTDTDCFVAEIETDDIYADMVEDSDVYDFSNYPSDHPMYNTDNKAVIGKFKDETCGVPILEFVGLRPKMYSILTIKGGETATPVLAQKNRAKGIQSSVVKGLTHQQYKDQLDAPTENYLMNKRIASKLHQIFTMEYGKRGLCAYDDKRFILEDGIHSLAYGHKDIEGRVTDTGVEPVRDVFLRAVTRGAIPFVGPAEAMWDADDDADDVRWFPAAAAASAATRSILHFDDEDDEILAGSHLGRRTSVINFGDDEEDGAPPARRARME